MAEVWNSFILNPIFNILVALYRGTADLGLSIILFTLIFKAITLPLTIPSMKIAAKQRDLQPEINALKAKYKDDKKKLAEKQMELLKKHGINPGAGCLTTIITFILMIAIYRAVNLLTLTTDLVILNAHIYFPALKFLATETINTKFLYLNLAKPDPYFVFIILAVVTQFIATKMMMPYSEIEQKAALQTKEKSDDFMAAMQKQNLIMMPLMYLIFGLTLPSGVMLYIFQIAQTYYMSGWGGLKPWIKKLKFAKKSL
jgi:YidC/Oxa1 family membrane protein insertase